MCSFGLTGLLVARLWSDPKNDALQIIGTIAFALGILIATIYKASRSSKRERKFEPLDEPKEIVGWAKGYIDQLRTELGSANLPDNRVRVTVHKVHHAPQRQYPIELEQVISYQGGWGKPPGRKTDARAGIIGLVSRTGSIEFSVRSDQQPLAQELVEEWGFHWHEASAISDRKSWLAMPILDDENERIVVGVVFVDSDDPAFFADRIKNLTIEKAADLAFIVRETYSKSGKGV